VQIRDGGKGGRNDVILQKSPRDGLLLDQGENEERLPVQGGPAKRKSKETSVLSGKNWNVHREVGGRRLAGIKGVNKEGTYTTE